MVCDVAEMCFVSHLSNEESKRWMLRDLPEVGKAHLMWESGNFENNPGVTMLEMHFDV